MSDNKSGAIIAGLSATVLGLIAIVVLLAVIAGILVYRTVTKVPDVNATAGNTAPQGATTPGTSSNANPTATAFDPKTATKVPAGMTPAQFVEGYYKAIEAGKFADAYKMLPLDKQQSYGDAASFEQQLKGYGISGYEVEAAVESGDEVSVVGWQKTPNGSFGYKWTLVKSGSDWVVKSRVQAGMK